VGGVLATKFIHPLDDSLKTRLKEYWALTEDKASLWKKWFDLASQHSLADGEYLNLYDLAFDYPESHAIRKDDDIYYAFFAQNMNENFSGRLQLRGLDESKKYQVLDYVQDQTLGEVSGNDPFVYVEVNGALLLKVTPVEVGK
jgi:alpha-galactosidase